MVRQLLGKGGDAETRPAEGAWFARHLDWNLLRTYHQIVQSRGVSQAARDSGRGQPAVSMALKRLEEAVGARLCHRGPSGFELTYEGEMVAQLCAVLFGAISDLPGDLASSFDRLRGRVRVQLISNLVNRRLDRALESFHKDYEKVEVFVSVSTWDVIKRNVLRNEVEIGISAAGEKDPDLAYELLFREVYRPFCGRSHPLFGKRLSQPADLAPYALILTGADEPDELTRFRLRHGLGGKIAGLSEHLEEARRLALLGIGVCFLPEAFAEREVRDGNLHLVLDSGDEPASDIYLISNPSAPPHRPRDLLLEHFQASRAEG